MKVFASNVLFINMFLVTFYFVSDPSWAGRTSGPFKHTYFDTIDSIYYHAYNTVKKSPKKKLQVFTANAQTRGVESLSSTELWISPPNVNLYATYAFPSKTKSSTPAVKITAEPRINELVAEQSIAPIANTSAISVANNAQLNDDFIDFEDNAIGLIHTATISVSQVLEKYNLNPQIKWPNDICLNRKKLCGVAASRFLKDKDTANEPENSEKFIMINISLNVNMGDDLLSSIDQPATSMAIEGNRNFDREEVLQLISQTLFQNMETFQREGFNFSTFVPYLEAHMIKFGQYTDVISTFRDVYLPDVFSGVFKSINSQGEMILNIDGKDRVVKHAHIKTSFSDIALRVMKGMTARRDNPLPPDITTKRKQYVPILAKHEKEEAIKQF